MRRMSFSPGKNNLKLLVLLEAGVQIWDVRELELINELRTPLDTARVEDGDWASSDRVVLAAMLIQPALPNPRRLRLPPCVGARSGAPAKADNRRRGALHTTEAQR